MRRVMAIVAGIAWVSLAPAASPPTPTPLPALGDTITLDVKDADLREVLLRRFAPRTRLNLVVDPEVKGSVTMRLQRVPFEEALHAIVTSNGWAWTVQGRILRIGHPEKL